ncbi:MAG: ester cyclase [Thermoleophilia bacterium]
MEANRATLARLAASFGDPARSEEYFAQYDEACTIHGNSPEPFGHAGLRAYYTALWAALVDTVLLVDAEVVEGDQAAWRWRVTGTHAGELLGVAATGRTLELAGQTFWRFGPDGRVLERWTVADALGLRAQLGLEP